MASLTFAAWKSNLERQMAAFREPIKVPVRVEVKNAPNLKLDEYLLDFAKQYMEQMFVKQFVIPEFKKLGLPNTPYPYMPHIEIGAGARGQTTYQRGVGRFETDPLDQIFDQIRTLENKIGAIDNRNKTKAAEKRQAFREQINELGKKAAKIQEKRDQRSLLDEGVKATPKGDEHHAIGLWKSGFQQMLNVMTQVTGARKDGTAIVVSMGNMANLLKQQLSSYNVTRGAQKTASKYNSFFYAAEFGTGIPSNLGTSRVNMAGRTKTSYNGVPGYWWYGTKVGNDQWTGGLFSGQRGTHFLFEPGSETPNPKFKEYIGETLQSSLSEFLRNKLR